jgi:hypothetical protein
MWEEKYALVKLMHRLIRLSCLPLLFVPWTLQAQTTKISTEYLMTLYAPLEAGEEIDSGLFIYNVRSGGWVKGPKINGTFVGPRGDWFRVLPSGVGRLDVSTTIETDDGR